MGLYTNLEAVRIRLIGKVKFTTNESDENKMHEDLANRLINEAEGQVEMDLSPRYATPFQTDDGKPFSQILNRTTKEVVRTLCEIMSVVRILETDFGRGSVVDADKYTASVQKRYDAILEKVMAKKKDGASEGLGFRFPPFPGLRLNYMNAAADDGFSGAILSTSSGQGDYPRAQINNPAENFWNGELDELDKKRNC